MELGEGCGFLSQRSYNRRVRVSQPRHAFQRSRTGGENGLQFSVTVVTEYLHCSHSSWPALGTERRRVTRHSPRVRAVCHNCQHYSCPS